MKRVGERIAAVLDELYAAVLVAGAKQGCQIRVDLPSEAIDALKAEADEGQFYACGQAILQQPLDPILEGALMIRNAVVIAEVRA